MKALIAFTLLSSVIQYGIWALSPEQVSKELGPQLSRSAVIIGWDAAKYRRWSDYHVPKPGVVVIPANEQDVAATVEYCTSKEIPFLTQNGGHGWTKTMHIDNDGLIINLKKLDSVTFNADKTVVTVGGGASVSQAINAASKNNALVQTANCNCIGLLGAILGAGYSNLVGLMGFGVDNILSFNAVMADGCLHTITPKDKNLFWAFRGAGPNFGIVTSAKMKSYPVSPSGQTAWIGQLIFTPDKLEKLVETIEAITLKPEMSVFLVFLTSGKPDYTPMVSLIPFYYGTEEEGRAAFSDFLDIGPINDTTTETQYPHWNDVTALFCLKGGNKPLYTAGLTKMVPSTWKEVWEEYVSFVSLGGTGTTLVLLEAYSLEKTRSFGQASSAYAWRNKINYNAVAIPWYFDPALESDAIAWASKVRDIWRSTDGLDSPAAYINFANDEDPSVVYGGNVDRLKAIKAKADPDNVFNQWFGL
ncbi:FAD binding domain-containing protein [Aspergillus sclerotioniger CBS 115572]|uniref:FAD binding domain-containing protein n=1 Tax=Aspergillus sclerotioniger CBS 115572 TaxID=1450535 RepID=A0A317X7N1_9EURO|nr:FAD binding domain-containing protein [Aspergillus sclerotioniger CBS 115572]PWY94626.1 FAD binding domain-containing protein [Aspergillus sclerotioniger CBS 115572]